ncbi:cryptochrome/photolyase family protein [Streptomyces roseolus]|uniref:cryptochrome/photolyase family protein n=1 Tax=Streptomyces roseolus TaxID=67358 RepID=UPI001671D217|nr:cryptochrome/photolyase family protein [Streptomyces roseolus]
MSSPARSAGEELRTARRRRRSSPRPRCGAPDPRPRRPRSGAPGFAPPPSSSSCASATAGPAGARRAGHPASRAAPCPVRSLDDLTVLPPRELPAGGQRTLRVEDFRRRVRRGRHLLVEGGGPVGGAWNLGHEDRRPPPRGGAWRRIRVVRPVRRWRRVLPVKEAGPPGADRGHRTPTRTAVPSRPAGTAARSVRTRRRCRRCSSRRCCRRCARRRRSGPPRRRRP